MRRVRAASLSAVAVIGLGLSAVAGAVASELTPRAEFGPVCGPVDVPELAEMIPDAWIYQSGMEERRVSFTAACGAHDACYHGTYSGSREAARARCDDAFLGDLLAACATLPATWVADRATCEAQARVYARAVERLGRPAYAATWAR